MAPIGRERLEQREAHQGGRRPTTRQRPRRPWHGGAPAPRAPRCPACACSASTAFQQQVRRAHPAAERAAPHQPVRPRARAAAATSQSSANVLEAAATCSRAEGVQHLHAAHRCSTTGCRRRAARRAWHTASSPPTCPGRAGPIPPSARGLRTAAAPPPARRAVPQVTRKREAGRAVRALMGAPFAPHGLLGRPGRGEGRMRTLIAPAPVRVPARGRPRSWRTPGSRPSRLRCR